MSKTQLRQAALESRRAIPRTRNAELSARVEENLFAQREFGEAALVASYVAMADEVQTAPILTRAISSGKRVAVPLVDVPSGRLLFFEIGDLSELSPGHFGVLEPRSNGRQVGLDETDCVLVPLLAWDRRGHRIGYGRGYFDRALKDRGDSVAIGLAFESQYVPHIPDQPSDVRLDMVVTEDGAVRFDPKGA